MPKGRSKGFGHYMNKKFFHPGNPENLERVFVAKEKLKLKEKVEKERLQEYQKEQQLWENRAAVSKTDGGRLSLSFMYDVPEAASRKEEEKKDDFKFDWQRTAPRQAHAKDDPNIIDQPFGIQVQMTKCMKCQVWGHQHTDKICPRYGKSADSEEPAKPLDETKLISQMKDQDRLQFTSYGAWDNGKVSKHYDLVYEDDSSTPHSDIMFKLIQDMREKERKVKRLREKVEKISGRKSSRKKSEKMSGRKSRKKKKKNKSKHNSDRSTARREDSRPNSRNSRPGSKDSRPRSKDSRPRSKDSRPGSKDSRPNSRDSRPRSKDSRPRSSDSRLKTRDSRPSSRDSRPSSRDSRPTSKLSTKRKAATSTKAKKRRVGDDIIDGDDVSDDVSDDVIDIEDSDSDETSSDEETNLKSRGQQYLEEIDSILFSEIQTPQSNAKSDTESQKQQPIIEKYGNSVTSSITSTKASTTAVKKSSTNQSSTSMRSEHLCDIGPSYLSQVDKILGLRAEEHGGEDSSEEDSSEEDSDSSSDEDSDCSSDKDSDACSDEDKSDTDQPTLKEGEDRRGEGGLEQGELSESEMRLLNLINMNKIDVKKNFEQEYHGDVNCHFCRTEETSDHLAVCPVYDDVMTGTEFKHIHSKNINKVKTALYNIRKALHKRSKALSVTSVGPISAANMKLLDVLNDKTEDDERTRKIIKILDNQRFNIC